MGKEEANFVSLVLARSAAVVESFDARHLVSPLLSPHRHIFVNEERICIGLMTTDHQLKASREGSK